MEDVLRREVDSRDDRPASPPAADIAVLPSSPSVLFCSTNANTPPQSTRLFSEASISTHISRNGQYHRRRSAVVISLAPPPIETIRRIQFPRIRKTADERCVPGTQNRERCAENTRADAERLEGVADVEGVYYIGGSGKALR